MMNFKALLRRIILACALFPVFINCSKVHSQNSSVKVLSYNIRYASKGEDPSAWEKRKDNVLELIKAASPDIFGLQEALKDQLEDISHAFPDFKMVGVGRDDGKEAGEYSPVFYNASRFSLLNSGTFWLSQTPLVAGSRGWDAACNRIVSWAKLKETGSGKEFFFFCTHFDHMGESARKNSAILILKAVDSLSAGKPAIVLGDFNVIPSAETYLILTDSGNSNCLVDSRAVCSRITGPECTFTGFKVNGIPCTRIDYIFVKRIEKVIAFQVDDTNNGEFYPSDHLPVSAWIEF